MLNIDHVILILCPYLRSLSSFVLLETYLILCFAINLRLRARSLNGHPQSRRRASHAVAQAPAGDYWGWVSFASVAAFWYQLVITGSGTGDIFFDHALGCNATTTVFVGFHFLVATRCKPRPSVSGLASAPGGHADKEGEEPSWKGWISRSYALRVAPRHDPRRAEMPEPKPSSVTSRSRFLAKQVFHLLGNFLLLDVLNTIAFEIPFFHPTPSKAPRPISLWELPLSLLHGGMIYAGLNIMYDAYCALSVTFANTKPEEWPPLFGDVREAWTVQRAWSRVWHQLMRNHLSSASTYLLRACPRRLSKHLDHVKFARVALAFTLSGLLHLAGEYHCLNSLHIHTHKHRPSSPYPSALRLNGVMGTFALQPLALGFEQILFLVTRQFFASPTSDAISSSWRPYMHKMAKGVGYIWVAAWFSFSMSFYTRSMMGAGFMTSTANIPRGWTIGAVRLLAQIMGWY